MATELRGGTLRSAAHARPRSVVLAVGGPAVPAAPRGPRLRAPLQLCGRFSAGPAPAVPGGLPPASPSSLCRHRAPRYQACVWVNVGGISQ